METLNKLILIYSDSNYNHAVNYSGNLYNYPITLNYGAKHARTKYILSSGNCDHITLMKDGVFIYVLSQNNGLNYISMMVINTESKEVEGSVFLSGNDIDLEDSFLFGILDKTEEEQVNILLNYIN